MNDAAPIRTAGTGGSKCQATSLTGSIARLPSGADGGANSADDPELDAVSAIETDLSGDAGDIDDAAFAELPAFLTEDGPQAPGTEGRAAPWIVRI